MSITALHLRHDKALTAFEQDFVDAGEARIPAYFADYRWPHERKVREVNGWAKGDFLKPGWSLCTTRFLERDGHLLGVVNVRHELTDALREVGGHIGYSVRPSARRQGVGTAVMRGGLDVCRDLGITQALVTCDETNLGSIRVIENNGGRLFETDARPGQPAICRFWVPVSG
ncbi:MAG: GNAT family N-acetyltransferase [Myxococcota bacterium]